MLHGIIEALPFSRNVRRLMTPAVYMLKAPFKGHVTVYTRRFDLGKKKKKINGSQREGGSGVTISEKPLLALGHLKIQGRILAELIHLQVLWMWYQLFIWKKKMLMTWVDWRSSFTQYQSLFFGFQSSRRQHSDCGHLDPCKSGGGGNVTTRAYKVDWKAFATKCSKLQIIQLN